MQDETKEKLHPALREWLRKSVTGAQSYDGVCELRSEATQ